MVATNLLLVKGLVGTRSRASADMVRLSNYCVKRRALGGRRTDDQEVVPTGVRWESRFTFGKPQARPRPALHSHSMVPGGLLVISNTQRFTPFTSLMMRLASFSSRSYGSFTQSAVMPSCDSTARMAMV